MQEPVSRQFVGIDLHRGARGRAPRPSGNVLGSVRVDNDPASSP